MERKLLLSTISFLAFISFALIFIYFTEFGNYLPTKFPIEKVDFQHPNPSTTTKTQ